MYMLLCGYPPFEGDSEILLKVKTMGFSSVASPEHRSRRLLKKALSSEKNRVAALHVLKDPWIICRSSDPAKGLLISY